MKSTFQDTEPSANYDGNVFFLVDSYVRENDFVYHKHKKGKINDKKRFDKERSFVVVEGSEPQVFDAQALVTPKYAKQFVPDPRLREILLDGRVKVSILLNTYGGQNIKEIFECMGKTVKKNAGDTDAYVAARAKSAGALIFETADSHFSTYYSDFMWHSPVFKYPHREKVRRQIADETLKNFEFFQRHTSPKHMSDVRKRFAAAIVDPHWPYNDVHLTGEELHRMGIIDRIYGNILELRKQFTRRTGIHIDTVDVLDNPLSAFFAMAELEERVYDETRFDLKLELDTKNKYIRCICSSLSFDYVSESQKNAAQRCIEDYADLPIRIQADYH